MRPRRPVHRRIRPGSSAAVRLAAWAAALVGGALVALLVALCSSDESQPSGFKPSDVLSVASGGETTAFNTTRNAFSLPLRNLTTEERRTFQVGDSFFTQNWVTAPASTTARDGLGPTFNAQSCSSCHALDGRARPPLNADDPERGLLLQLSLPEQFRSLFAPDSPIGSPVPDPVYGTQLQDRAILGVTAEGVLLITYTEIHGEYADGEPYTLLRPTYEVIDLAFGPLHDAIMTSPRIAPAIFGVGLLEAISEADIRAQADPDDLDGDGISGRVSIVWDVSEGAYVLGRFGWKASTPTVRQQAAGAFHADIGITSSLFAEQNCPAAQSECAAAPSGADRPGEAEVPDKRLDQVVFYNLTLAPAAGRGYPERERGAELFFAAGCHRCHTPRYTTGDYPIAALSGQTILPYTDLLLHDMGEGLADGRPVFEASGREWRTPPLWGIGLFETVSGHIRLLHDGRARGVAEAILWHGGEGEASREAFRTMSKEDREALIEFIKSL